MSDRWIMYITTNHKTWVNRLTQEEFEEVFDEEGQKILNWGAVLDRPSGGICVDLINAYMRLRVEVGQLKEGGLSAYEEQIMKEALEAPDGCDIDE